MTFIINDTLGACGGSHTLILRMCKWLSENSYSVAVFCDFSDNTEIVNSLKRINVQIFEVKRPGINHIKELIQSFQDDQITVLSFYWNYYLDLECIKKKYKLTFNNLIYCIHPETFMKGLGLKSSLLRNIAKRKYFKILERMNANNSLIMIDDINIQETESYYGVGFSKKPSIIYLPMIVDKIDKYEEIIQEGYNGNMIMTAARSDFPYKGYMIGLVSEYAILKKQYQQLKMIIVTSGEDVDKLYQKIYQQEKEVIDSITVYSWMNYEELKKLMESCKVYIGMGTSVFDASLRYKPSIAVRFNTYDLIGESLTCEKPEKMTVEDTCQSNARDLICKVLEMKYDEYRKVSKDSYNSVRNLYDIEINMKKLCEIHPQNRTSIITSIEYIVHRLNDFVNVLRHRNTLEYNRGD